MIGTLWRIGKTAAHVIPFARAAFDPKAQTPVPVTKFDAVIVDLSSLVRSVADAKSDGKITRDEVVDLVVEAVMIALRHLLGINLTRV